MVYDVVISQMNCLEGNQFLLEAPYMPGMKRTDRNVLGAHIRSSVVLPQAVVCSQLKTSSIRRSPIEMVHPMSLLPVFLSENLIAFLSQGHSAEPTSITLKNRIPEFCIQSDPKEVLWERPILKIYPQFPLYRLLIIYSRAFVRVFSDFSVII